jgi:hypothetical protein
MRGAKARLAFTFRPRNVRRVVVKLTRGGAEVRTSGSSPPWAGMLPGSAASVARGGSRSKSGAADRQSGQVASWTVEAPPQRLGR